MDETETGQREQVADAARDKWKRIEAFWRWTGRTETGETLLELFDNREGYELLRLIHEGQNDKAARKMQARSAWRIVGPIFGYEYDVVTRSVNRSARDDELAPPALRERLNAMDGEARQRRASEWVSYLRGDRATIPALEGEARAIEAAQVNGPEDTASGTPGVEPTPVGLHHGETPFEPNPGPHRESTKGRGRWVGGVVAIALVIGVPLAFLAQRHSEKTLAPQGTATRGVPVSSLLPSSLPAPSGSAQRDPAPLPKSGLEVRVEAERDGRVVPIDAEHPFRTKDGFHFKVTVRDPGYLSILAINDGTEATRLYPREGDVDGPIEANTTRLVPGAQDQEAAFVIERDAPVERLVVVATTRSTQGCDARTLLERAWKDPLRPATWPANPDMLDPPTPKGSDAEDERNAARRKRRRCDYAVLGATFVELPHGATP
ncbi:MAG TPA: DUF4384 domain-containing protein [Polyangiaceae bacterium]|jgi:hypothetical protein|nr:DUF4384 domain-containing protein [Polyangiaceae bacterium]